MAARYLGIDFSGGAAPWHPRASRPTVWVSSLLAQGGDLRLECIQPVQRLPGAGSPFERMVELLAAGAYVAAAIDTPFSIPRLYLPVGGQRELVATVGALPPASDRPFPRGGELVALADGIAKKTAHKPLRACERYWADRKINTRSTLWNGPRGGARSRSHV
jgi:hypothetical protein